MPTRQHSPIKPVAAILLLSPNFPYDSWSTHSEDLVSRNRRKDAYIWDHSCTKDQGDKVPGCGRGTQRIQRQEAKDKADPSGPGGVDRMLVRDDPNFNGVSGKICEPAKVVGVGCTAAGAVRGKMILSNLI